MWFYMASNVIKEEYSKNMLMRENRSQTDHFVIEMLR